MNTRRTAAHASALKLLTAVSIAITAGCGGGGGGDGPADPPAPPPVAATGLLVTPANDNAFVQSFTRQLAPRLTTEQDAENEAPGFASPPTLSTDGGAFSTTYQLEDGVDEYDVMQYDGERLFIAPTRGGCCFVVEPLAGVALPPPQNDGEKRIRILATDVTAASATEVGAIALAPQDTIEGLYLDGDQLVALSSSAWWGAHGDAFDSIVAWEGQRAGVRVYNVADPASPQIEWELELDGALISSRRLGDTLIVVTRHLPGIDGLDYAPLDDAARAANQTILDSLGAQDLLPKVSVNGSLVNSIGIDNCLITDADNELAPPDPGYPVLTTILSIDLATQSLGDARCYADTVDGVYMSPNAVYLAQTVWEEPNIQDTIVHRFDLGEQLAYRGSGRVGGSLTARGQVDFRMSEFDGVLRLVTTRFTNDETDAFDHQLYTLALDDNDPELRTLGRYPGTDEVPPLGKPNEDLFGVRFLGERAYLVTFERIDPLYVMDLRDPASPRLLGELEVEGFSDLLHPVNDNLLLGVGDDGAGRVKVELYNVQDPTNPLSQGAAVLAKDAQWSYSEARYNRQAFTYLADASSADRFTVPVTLGVDNDAGFEQRNRLYMFEIVNTTNPLNAVLNPQGFLSATTTPFYEDRPRSIIQGDTVFFVLGQDVWGGFWGQEGPASGGF
jgi:hypothetical protein